MSSCSIIVFRRKTPKMLLFKQLTKCFRYIFSNNAVWNVRWFIVHDGWHQLLSSLLHVKLDELLLVTPRLIQIKIWRMHLLVHVSILHTFLWHNISTKLCFHILVIYWMAFWHTQLYEWRLTTISQYSLQLHFVTFS